MLANGVIIESAYHDDKKITDYTFTGDTLDAIF